MDKMTIVGLKGVSFKDDKTDKEINGTSFFYTMEDEHRGEEGKFSQALSRARYDCGDLLHHRGYSFPAVHLYFSVCRRLRRYYWPSVVPQLIKRGGGKHGSPLLFGGVLFVCLGRTFRSSGVSLS